MDLWQGLKVRTKSQARQRRRTGGAWDRRQPPGRRPMQKVRGPYLFALRVARQHKRPSPTSFRATPITDPGANGVYEEEGEHNPIRVTSLSRRFR